MNALTRGIVTLVMLSLFSVSTLAQDNPKPTKEDKRQAEEEKRSRPEIKYDKFKDETTITTPMVLVSDNLGLKVIAIYQGQTITAPRFLELIVYSLNTFTHSRDTEMILLIDDERVVLKGRADYSSYLGFIPITLHTLKRIVGAKSVEGQIESVEFKLKPEHQKAIARITAYFEGK